MKNKLDLHFEKTGKRVTINSAIASTKNVENEIDDAAAQEIYSILEKNVKQIIPSNEAIASDLSNHKNMMTVDCIQVSTGFNQNDHYFIPSELWKARNTPVYQLVDWMHDRDKILGCIVEAKAKYQDGKDIDEDEEIDETCSFDLHNKMVVWKHVFKDEAKEIEEKASKGELFVSMECYFDDYDFALQELTSKKVSIVKRNEQTDFLTDYLKVLGGKGKYGNFRVGIAFRDITFLGTGFVDDPANIRSEITEVAAIKEDNSVNNSDIIDKLENFGVNNSELKNLLEIGENVMDYKVEYEAILAEKEKIVAEKVTAETERAALAAKVEAFEAEAKEVRTYSSKDDGESVYSYTAINDDGEEVEVTNKTVYTHASVTTVTEELTKDLMARKQEIQEFELKVAELEAKNAEASVAIKNFEVAETNRARKEAVSGLVVEITDEELFAMSGDSFAAMIKFAPKKEVVVVASVEPVADDSAVIESAIAAVVVATDDEAVASTTTPVVDTEAVLESKLCAALAANIR